MIYVEIISLMKHNFNVLESLKNLMFKVLNKFIFKIFEVLRLNSLKKISLQ